MKSREYAIIIDDGEVLEEAARRQVCICCGAREDVKLMSYRFVVSDHELLGSGASFSWGSDVRKLRVPLCRRWFRARLVYAFADPASPRGSLISDLLMVVLSILAVAFFGLPTSLLCVVLLLVVPTLLLREFLPRSRYVNAGGARFSTAFKGLRSGEKAIAFGVCGYACESPARQLNWPNAPLEAPARVLLVIKSDDPVKHLPVLEEPTDIRSAQGILQSPILRFIRS